MPVVHGVDIPPPPNRRGRGGGGPRPTRRRPQQPRRRPPPPPPPVPTYRYRASVSDGWGPPLALLAGFLVIAAVAWVALGVVRGAVGVMKGVGEGVVNTSSTVGSAVRSRVSSGASAGSEAISSLSFPRLPTPPDPAQRRTGASGDRSSVPEPSSRPDPSGVEIGVEPGTGETWERSVEGGRGDGDLAPSRAVPVEPRMDLERTRQAMEEAEHRLRTGDYVEAHRGLRLALVGLDERGAPNAATEALAEGEALIHRIIRACRAEREVLSNRGQAPVCPDEGSAP